MIGRRRLVLGGLAALVVSGCGGSSGREIGPADDVTVGGGVVVQEDERPTRRSEPEPLDVAPPGDQVSPHPTDASGRPIANTTIREADGLVLQLTVDRTVGYEGDLVIDLVVTNQRAEVIRYDPAPGDGAYVVDESGTVVWRNGRCAGVPAAGHPVLAPDDTARLTFQLRRDGGGDSSCVLAPGRYQVVGQLFWCDAGSSSGGQCTDLSSTASHPVPITLGGG